MRVFRVRGAVLVASMVPVALALQVSRRALVRGASALAGVGALALEPQRAQAATEIKGVLYDTHSGVAMPASPEALGSLVENAVLGTWQRTRGVLCVAERHDSFDHHLAQLRSIKTLTAAVKRRDESARVAVGLEAFQRTHQVWLDRFVNAKAAADGSSDFEDLLKAVSWDTTWGYDPYHYLPILDHARKTRTRLVGLSPPPELLALVEQKGVEAVYGDPVCSKFLPEGGVDDALGGAARRKRTLDGMAAKKGCDEARVVDIQNFRDEYMSESVAMHYETFQRDPVDRDAQRDGWLVVLAGSRHVAHRDGMPHRIARRVAAKTNDYSRSDAVYRGVHTIIPEVLDFPVEARKFPSTDYGDYVWYMPRRPDFDPKIVNNAPRPPPAAPAHRPS
jgi:uncharacterized iron-regulated protein